MATHRRNGDKITGLRHKMIGRDQLLQVGHNHLAVAGDAVEKRMNRLLCDLWQPENHCRQRIVRPKPGITASLPLMASLIISSIAGQPVSLCYSSRCAWSPSILAALAMLMAPPVCRTRY